MAEPINPRLIARVERSLRKRLNSNIGPHLQRCAAHARNENEFMAAAGRLLLNPLERHEWLASWTPRRISGEAADTAPAELDALPPAAPTSETPSAFAPSSSFHSVPGPLSITSPTPAVQAPAAHPIAGRLGAAQRERLREALATELGPIADVLIDKESLVAGSIGELMQRLEAHLDTEAQRLRFRAFAQP